MKKLLLCGIAFSVALSVSAQNRVGNHVTLKNASRYNKVAKAQAQTTGIDNFTPARVPAVPSASVSQSYRTSSTQTEFVIGNTLYDLQSNRGPARRILNNGDGTISAAWTFSANQSGYPDRGTGYNYYNGSTWAATPTARIEGAITATMQATITVSA